MELVLISELDELTAATHTMKWRGERVVCRTHTFPTARAKNQALRLEKWFKRQETKSGPNSSKTSVLFDKLSKAMSIKFGEKMTTRMTRCMVTGNTCHHICLNGYNVASVMGY
jgi:hypothetical protein